MKLAGRMDRLGTETAFEVLAKAKRLEAEGMDIIHLEIGEPDFDTPENIVEAGVQALKGGYTHYGPSPGLMEVRERIAQEVSRTRDISATADNVVVTPGGKPIMFFVMLALVDEGDEVLYPNPGFPIYESMINFVGGVPVPIRLSLDRDFDLDVDEVAGQITSRTRLMILNSPNNPCGSIIGKGELEALAGLATEHDIPILSDEIYSRFLYEGEHHSVASFPGMTDRTIILDGFSKTYAMTGWRIGYGVMPLELVEPISRLSTNSVSCTASFTQMAALEAMDGPQEEPYKIVAEFKKRRDIIVNGLNRITGIRCPMPKGAFYVFPDVKGTGMTSREFADGLLEDEGVACLAGESFGEYGKGCVRFSFANSAENIERALERINRFVAKGA
jgi:aspartate/methionine/tyrosine aminotransferase